MICSAACSIQTGCLGQISARLVHHAQTMVAAVKTQSHMGKAPERTVFVASPTEHLTRRTAEESGAQCADSNHPCTVAPSGVDSLASALSFTFSPRTTSSRWMRDSFSESSMVPEATACMLSAVHGSSKH